MDTGLCDLKENEGGLPDIQGSDQEDLEEVLRSFFFDREYRKYFYFEFGAFFARQNNTENM